MRLNPNQVGYNFAITSDGIIDYVHLYDCQNIKSDVVDYLQELIDACELVIGDGCDGEIIIENEVIRVVYAWVSTIGLFSFGGKLERETLEFPNK